MTEVRRLVGLAGFSGSGLETFVRLSFVNGFSEAIRMELEQIENIINMSMNDILSLGCKYLLKNASKRR